MRNAIQWIRSLIFIAQMYVMLPLIGFGFIPLALINREYSYWIIRLYCNWVRWTASWMVGLRSEIRGEVPQGTVLVAAKHQSFFDILLLAGTVPRMKFIMKSELRWAPVINLYGKWTRSIPVNRGKRGAAVRQMVAAVKAGADDGSQLIIFPQGTRAAVGSRGKYKIGTGVLYKETGLKVVPAATNVGVFWKRHGIMRHPGLAVLEFLPPIEPGLELGDFMAEMEDVIETASDALLVEAGVPEEIVNGVSTND
ncbi:MAG: 1-acyl-sn-glycerol-3-phosphate acyltransferase [Rhodobacteraceae bacterium]|nr:1-acyl-sn-glycerol-3-phosphate acyltransferase [Paracoccaceae bacterium]